MRIRAMWWLCGMPMLALPLMWVAASADEPAKTEAPAAKPAATAKEVEAGDIKLSVPDSWKQQQTTSQFRLAQFSIPAAEGDADAGEFYISPPIGGSPEANIGRWVGQFEGDGRELVMSKGKCPQGDYILVQLSGTFKRSIGPPIQQKTKPAPGYKMNGVILSATKDGKSLGNYFLKLTGPAKTVAASEEALRASFGADKSKEEKYELP